MSMQAPISHHFDLCRYWVPKRDGRTMPARLSLREEDPLPHHKSSIHGHRMADHEGSRIRTKPNNSCGNLLGLTQPSDRLQFNQLLATLRNTPAEPFHHRSFDRPRTNSIDADI